jgi:hypothetical protein
MSYWLPNKGPPVPPAMVELGEIEFCNRIMANALGIGRAGRRYPPPGNLPTVGNQAARRRLRSSISTPIAWATDGRFRCFW